MIFQNRGLLVLGVCVTITLLTRTTTAAETANATDTVLKESRGVPLPGPGPIITTTENPNPTDPAENLANTLAVDYINICRDAHNSSHVAYDPSLQTAAKAAAKFYAAAAAAGTSTTPITLPTQIVYQKYFKPQFENENAGTLLFARELLETTGSGRLGFEDKFTKWYTGGVNRYNYAKPEATLGESLQFFTQMMWKSSTKVGCACDTKLIQAAPKLYLCSCVFSPAGNTRTGYGDSGLALYKTNVLPLK